MSRTEQSTSLLDAALPITNVVVLDRAADSRIESRIRSRVDDLLVRMRTGDRQAAAEFLGEYGARLRRRIRGKLNVSMRRLFDSLDILSTVGRRLDLYVMSGRLTAANELQLWSLMFQMADHALVDKARLFRRLQTTEGEDSEFARDMVLRMQKAEQERSDGVELEIERCMKAVPEAIDRRILSLWLTGEPLNSVAAMLDMSAPAVRKRWETLKSTLRDRLSHD